jgi:hypothetical protein
MDIIQTQNSDDNRIISQVLYPVSLTGDSRNRLVVLPELGFANVPVSRKLASRTRHHGRGLSPQDVSIWLLPLLGWSEELVKKYIVHLRIGLFLRAASTNLHQSETDKYILYS